MDTRQIKDRLCSSLEMHTLWRNQVIVVAVVIPITLFYSLISGGWIFAAIMVGTLIVPTVLFRVIRTIRIYRNTDQ